MFLLTGQSPVLSEPKGEKNRLLAHAEKDESKGYENEEYWPFGGGEIVANNHLCGKKVATCVKVRKNAILQFCCFLQKLRPDNLRC